GPELVLEVGAGAQVRLALRGLRAEDVGGNAAGPLLRLRAVEAQGPLLLVALALAQPVDEGPLPALGIALTPEVPVARHTQPYLEGEPVPARRHAEGRRGGHLDVRPRLRPVQPDRGVPVERDGPGQAEVRAADVFAVPLVPRGVVGRRANPLAQPPVAHGVG